MAFTALKTSDVAWLRAQAHKLPLGERIAQLSGDWLAVMGIVDPSNAFTNVVDAVHSALEVQKDYQQYTQQQITDLKDALRGAQSERDELRKHLAESDAENDRMQTKFIKIREAALIGQSSWHILQILRGE